MEKVNPWPICRLPVTSLVTWLTWRGNEHDELFLQRGVGGFCRVGREILFVEPFLVPVSFNPLGLVLVPHFAEILFDQQSFFETHVQNRRFVLFGLFRFLNFFLFLRRGLIFFPLFFQFFLQQFRLFLLKLFLFLQLLGVDFFLRL